MPPSASHTASIRMPAPAPAAPPPAATEAASTAALIAQIAAEARSTGKSLTFDPETGKEAADDDSDGTPQRDKTGKFLGRKRKDEAEEDEAEAEETAAEEGDEETDEGEVEERATPGEIDMDAVSAAVNAEGGVDILALAKALGKDPEELGVSPAQHKAIRLSQKKATQTLARANSLAERLQKQFGDRVAARKAVEAGDLQPGIDCVEAIFGMSWNDLNRAVAATLAGKPLPDLENKRELRELKKKDAERAEAAKKADEEKATSERTEAAKAFIGTKIKGDKLASPEVAKLLKDAGLPSITDLVFEELKAGYARGMTDPKKALELVRQKLTKQAKALAAGGLVTLPKPAGAKPAVSASKPRAGAQAGAAGNSREMTDAELRASVLKDAGLGPRR
jgi:hypothetical protein